MSSEIDKALAALRHEQAQAQLNQNSAISDASTLVNEFSQMMLARHVPTVPVYMTEQTITPGRRKSFLQSEKPRIWHTSFRVVAEAWPVGRFDNDSSQPDGYLDTPVVTTDGRLVNATWGQCSAEPSRGRNLNEGPDYGVASLFTCETHARMVWRDRSKHYKYLYVNDGELSGQNAPYFRVNARLLAEAVQHYLG
ncbi:hypothetical protein HQ325_02795 [Rhodococcus sp. BP-349]|uniref:hypothetical protein n=1 Tax=unclassified Rhodococcus (in: high G+C Gram-positive bacteria) TaxID=192944 RepID=UPI001C9AFA8A|nr:MULTISPECIES: hypothetical protein [unclassified Rhodococcus (in: high G+C Gram-positive bacteria)]MBY6537591.1 hypothetical protein [Rhodococcus sp. BP-363]MBY6541928.1 hypothetical protein [Rhodococcus sp. BP-369]MBY6561158.1 hypothetical protein [Rhodococcus sp. BP-370]MBY6575450.1 hypothetical protein [Rhodococcus sp. BP-364]MBY6584751.1 hypothetical protein [Rhodococcus sp. BP-358]